MRKFILSVIVLSLVGLVSPLKAQLNDGHERLKKHINSVVEKVEEAESPLHKREILDGSLEEMIQAIDKIKEKKSISESDKKGLAVFKDNLVDRKNELNGLNGFKKVPNNQLNQYANYIQQNVEQADAVTISVTTALLIVIILLLL